MIGRVFHLMVLIFLISAYALTYLLDTERGRAMYVTLLSIPFVLFIPNALFLGADKYMPAQHQYYKSTIPARFMVLFFLVALPVINYFLCLPINSHS